MGNLMNRNQVNYTPEELARAKHEAQRPLTLEDVVGAVLNIAAWIWLVASVIAAIGFGIEFPFQGILIFCQGCVVWAMMLALAIILKRLQYLQYNLDKKLHGQAERGETNNR